MNERVRFALIVAEVIVPPVVILALGLCLAGAIAI